ncbi:hypothetical protein QBC39DRAFT_357911 [Podospora conica]|nr:hypothetical protein QBC39DRAFT_357911 [Schizothecium conicum]
MQRRNPLPRFQPSLYFAVKRSKMATDSPDPGPTPPTTTTATATATATSSEPSAPTPTAPFDIVKTYNDILASDPEMTMPVAAIESLIELLRVTPASTAMETVEVVKTQKARLLAAAPNPLPLLAGADLFEQFLLRSLRGPTARNDSGVLSFEDTISHLLQNSLLFAERARAARKQIAIHGSRFVGHNRVVLAAGGSRVVTQILLHAAENRMRHFKVIYVVDGSPRTTASVNALRAAGIEVETIREAKVAYVLTSVSNLTLVLVGAEAVLQDGGIISRMGTCQLGYLAKKCPGYLYRQFLVAAETHKIVRMTPITNPMEISAGVKQHNLAKWDNIGHRPETQADKPMLAEEDEVEYVERELIDGIITEQGVKMPWVIWEMVDDYI